MILRNYFNKYLTEYIQELFENQTLQNKTKTEKILYHMQKLFRCACYFSI